MKCVFPYNVNRRKAALCAAILLVALFVCVLSFMSFPAKAAEVVSTGSCGNNATYTFTDDGVLTISGTGAIDNHSYSLYSNFKSSITSIVIEDGITHIGSYAFYLLSSAKSLIMADSVVSIGPYAFASCGLTSVTLSSNLSAIPDSCFASCKLDGSIVIPDSVTSIGSYAFQYCKLTSLTIPESVIELKANSLYGLDLLSAVYFEGGTPPEFGVSLFSSGFKGYLWVPAGSVASYKSSSNMAYFAKFFVEVGTEPHFDSIPLSDYLTSTLNEVNALIRKFGFSNAYYCAASGLGSFQSNFIDYYYFPMSFSSLSWYDSCFYVGDIVQDALSYSFTSSITYTATGTPNYTGSREFNFYYFDADGAYISYDRLGYTYGFNHLSGTHTYTFSGTPTFPANTAYVVLISYVSGFSGMTVSDFRFDFELTVNYDPPVPPPTPTVNSHFNSAYSYNVGDVASPLNASIGLVSSGDLTYQWYENTVNSTSGGTPIPYATMTSYQPILDYVGTKYYYLAVTNALNGLTVTVYSNVAAVTVSKPVAGAPTVSSNFAPSYTYKIGDTASSLSVAASAPDGGLLSYLWYVRNPDESYDALPIYGATDSSYVPALDFVGTRYYYCIVTNTLGDSTAWVQSDTVMITVKASTYTLSAGQYECFKDSSGAYLPLAAWPKDEFLSYDIRFRASGVQFYSMTYAFDVMGSDGAYGLYYTATKAYTFGSSHHDPGFLSQQYALIYLETDQVVSTEFYEWFIASFEYVGADEDIPIYYTTINIMDNAGNNLLDGITYPGMGVSPILYGYVVGNGLTVLTSSGLDWPWTVGDDVDEFLGFSLEPGATAAWYIPEETFTIGGTASDAVLTLYLVVTVSTSVDDDFAASSLKWYERLFYGIDKGFARLNTAINDGFSRIEAIFDPLGIRNVIGGVDLVGVFDFFKLAFENFADVFGLLDLLDGDSSPFAWLEG